MAWKKILMEGDVAADLSDVTPLSVGTTGAAGTGSAAARDDHVHDLGADAIDSGLLIADAVVGAEHIAANAVGATHIDETDTGIEMSQITLTPKIDGIGTVEGSIFYDSDDDHVYVYTAA